MARGNHRGRGGGSRGSPHGQSSSDRGGRGGGRGRGRGRGRGDAPNFGGGGGGRGGAAYADDLDFPVQMWPDHLTYNGTVRGRGRGRGSYPGSGHDSPAARGTDRPRGRNSFRGRGRGESHDTYNTHGRGRPSRGQLDSKLRAGVPLSSLLNEDRPLLKPIVFVRSVHTATLFQEEEEILQPIVEAVADDEKSHVPTADQVSRHLEEIDFADVGKLQAEVDAIASTMSIEESDFRWLFVDTTPTPVAARPHHTAMTDRIEGALGEDEEIIVYVAPHPRLSRATTPAPVAETVETITMTSILTGRQLTKSHETHTSASTPLPSVPEGTIPPEVPSASQNVQEVAEATPTTPQPTELPSVPSPPPFEAISFSFESSSRKKQTRKLFPRSKKARRRTPRRFGAFGALASEAQAQREGRERDPRESEQRRGDSDVNFGDTSDEDIEQVSNGIGAMELDAEISVDAMKSFVQSMNAEGSRHITMDDIADGERMRAEDEQGATPTSSRGSDGESEEDDAQHKDEELEGALAAEERALIGEESEEEDEDESSDEEDTPRAGFRARLARMRARDNGRGKGKGKARQVDDSSDEDMDNVALADEDEAFIAEIQEMLDANVHILSNRDKKGKKNSFRAIEDDIVSDDDESAAMMTPAARRKDKHVPPELKDQWEKDRQKKAENKRKRKEDMIAVAADPLAVHKGGKKGRKAMLAAARLEQHMEVENRIVDFVSLEAQIRRFIEDIGDKSTMALPPCDKETRKKIHELADAFNLKSQSKGTGRGRYTTLIKTSRSGVRINEKKIGRITKTNKDSTWGAPWQGKGKGKAGQSLAKHREGEEVGKAAPKIGESNVGFRMLAAMGWAEGERIGLSGGLDAPLTAKMKKTKLGLGATM
ncbi:uncharacterized protein B0H18DRAFT_985975 [Fomitopsis serialis]|uniref:uncharacterized protein n=1 Tax=Fomitopsis serialis TaxID=139415 RepID=UPI00200844CF|nr:uncharacterized protein B0H18DRAFT_985975 [Neoantrodia serialis]KAH9932509.1 hypothetical protein B0H18DRAFT_985975 [Neoantrodia serialis]